MLKEKRKRIEAFKIWWWGSVLKIPWTKKDKNEEKYQRMNKRKKIWKIIKKGGKINQTHDEELDQGRYL